MKNRQHHMQDQKKSNKTLQLASLALAVASVNWMPAAVAQDAGQGQSFGFLEEIVVTARRREESAQDIPVAVTAMNSDMLRSQNITELNDLGAHVPSFRVSNAGSSTNTPVLSIRGQRPSDVSMTLDQAVPIYFGEVVMTPAEGSNLSMYDLENVQVLKGPQGTLFGRNSTGGALLLTPKAPGTTFGGYLETKLGNFNMRSVEGAVDLPVNDMLQFRVAGHALKRDGYQENVAENSLHGEDYWDEDSRGIRISMNLELSEDLSNLLVVSYDENDMMGRLPVVGAMNYSTQLGQMVNLIHNGALGGPNAFDDAIARQQGRDVHKIESDVAGRDKIENHFVANTTQYHINDDLSIKNVFGYRKVKMSSATDIDGTALPIFGVLTEGEVTRNPNAPATKAEQFSNEIQLLGNSFGGDLDWIVGAYWYDMQGSTGGQILNIVGANPNWVNTGIDSLDPIASMGLTQISPNGDVHNEAYGLFGEGTYRFDDQWALTVGLRQSWDKRSVTAKNYQGAGSMVGVTLTCNMHDESGNVLPENACGRSESESYSSPTWRTSLSYTPNETMYYGSVSTGYRAGGFNLRGTDNASLAPFDEETVLTYEIGSKSDWEFDNWGSVRANFAAYWQDYSDIQKTQGTVTADGSFGTATVNAAEATIKGFEADVTWAPTANLLLTLGYSFVDASYEEWDVPVGAITLDASDSYFTYVPENSATASARYILPVDSSVGEISVMASVYWQDKMKTNPISNLFPQMAALQGWSDRDLEAAMSTEDADGYALWNFRVDWHNVMGSDFALAAFINNATDEEYQVGGLNVIDSLGIFAPTYGAPRTIGASLRYDF
jgi:iron complex outermembrane receptor protein